MTARPNTTSLRPCDVPNVTNLETIKLFDSGYKEHEGSAIDEYLHRTKEIHRLYDPNVGFNDMFAQLQLLGIIGAAESYFRTLFRRLIGIDDQSKRTVEKLTVQFGAATMLSKKMLPESILESYSFASGDNIKTAIKQLAGIEGDPPLAVKDALARYERICQLRHCAIHRFGKLGVKNAIQLGLDEHRPVLEKPLKLSYASFQQAATIVENLVRTINCYLFEKVIWRVPLDVWHTTGSKVFKQYLQLFYENAEAVQCRKLFTTFKNERLPKSSAAPRNNS